MKKYWSLPLLYMALFLLIDQGTKIWVRVALAPSPRQIPLIPQFLDLIHVENKGVSFSFMGNLPDNIRVPLLVGISLVAVLGMIFYWVKYRGEMDRYTDVAFILLLPGAFGNLIDRALRGTVTDFMHFKFFSTSFFVNNFADIFISAGVVSYLISIIVQSKKPAVEDKPE